MRVPQAVVKIQRYVASPNYRAFRSKFVLAGIDRLVRREEVFPVWAGMPRRRDLPDPLDFLAACEQALSAWERMPREPAGETKKKLASLARDARTLADKLDGHAREIEFYGIPLFIANHLASISTELRDKHERHTLPYLYDPQHAIGPVKFPLLLRELARRLDAPTRGSVPHRPTKMRAKNAERTFLVRSLVDFFRRNGGEPLWEWVAFSVAAMTDGDPLDVRHVQILAEGIQPAFSDPGEELLWYSKLWDAEHDNDS